MTDYQPAGDPLQIMDVIRGARRVLVTRELSVCGMVRADRQHHQESGDELRCQSGLQGSQQLVGTPHALQLTIGPHSHKL